MELAGRPEGGSSDFTACVVPTVSVSTVLIIKCFLNPCSLFIFLIFFFFFSVPSYLSEPESLYAIKTDREATLPEKTVGKTRDGKAQG